MITNIHHTLKIILFLLAVIACSHLHAADGDVFYANTIEGVRMALTVISEAKKTCEVGVANENTINESTIGAITIPSNANGYSVISIGFSAFYECTGLTSITIPNSVISIGFSAFFGCSGLTSITIPDSVTYIGDYAFNNCSSLTSINIPNSLTSIGNYAFQYCHRLTSIDIPNSVTSIGVHAFSGCRGLTSIDIPNSVTSIGRYAFGGCAGLTSLIIPNSMTSINEGLFSGCSSLTSITIGNSVKSIGNSAFSSCSGLTSLAIPNSVTSIGFFAFSGCSSLTNVTIPNSVTRIDGSAFSDCSSLTSITIPVTNLADFCNNNIVSLVTSAIAIVIPIKLIDNDGNEIKEYNIPDGVKSIGGSAFSHCTDLTCVTIPNSVTSIGSYAFDGCSGLTSITIPNSVTSINESAFRSCTGLTSLTIPNSVTSIGGSAFSGCSGLTSVTISSSVTSIGNFEFSGCSGLTSITIPSSVTSIGGSAFAFCSGLTSIKVALDNPNYDSRYSCNAIIETATNTLITGCKNSVIPNGITRIGDYAFSGCSGLTSISIPNSVTSIGGSAFDGCSGLTSITIPNSVTSIGGSAFSGCSGLTSITIPNSMTSIGYYAFWGCSGLTSIISYIKVPFVIYNYVFESSVKTKATLSIPYWSKVRYEKTEGWKDFVNVVEREIAVGDIFTAKTNENIDMNFMITDLESKTCQVGWSSENETAVNRTTKGTLTIPTTAEGYVVTGIASHAFSGCESLTKIFIPNTITEIAKNAFVGCIGLTNIVVDANNTIYDSRDNSNALIETASNTLLVGSGNTVIPATVTAIADHAFYGMTGLTAITLPASLNDIGTEAFSHADRLDSVRSEITEPFTIPSTAFLHSDGEAPVLLVPWDSKEKYQTAEGWSQFAKMIEFAPSDGFEFAAESDGVMLHFKVTDRENRKCQVELTEQNAAHITIPREVRDQTVASISDRAFANCTELLSISFPETATATGSHVLEGCGSLAAIRWDANVEVPAGVTEDAANPNLLLYVKNKDYAPFDIQNVVADGVAESIVLKDAASGNNFYCTEQFTAKRITYTHHYSMTSGYKECQGWETIALPFDVAAITHESNADMTPITLWEVSSSQRPFWLYEQTSAGWQSATAIKANTPYIICMPNNNFYSSAYNITGDVTFTGQHVSVMATDNVAPVSYGNRKLVANYSNKEATNLYALNADNLWSKNTTELPDGSAFIHGLRQVRPFEAYMTVEGAAAPEIIPVFEDGMATDIIINK